MQADIILKDDIFFLMGNLNFANVMSVFEKSLSYFNERKTFTFDFKYLKSNSAGIALIVEWVKLAKQQEKQIEILHLPSNLIAIMEAAGMEEILKN